MLPVDESDGPIYKRLHSWFEFAMEFSSMENAVNEKWAIAQASEDPPLGGSRGEAYNFAAETLRDATVKAFNFMASRLGNSGFQASWAALSFYGEVSHIKSPYIVLKLEDMLFPQYDLHAKLGDFIAENQQWVGDEARKKLAEQEGTTFPAHPNVLQHWKLLSEEFPAPTTSEESS